MREVRQFFAGVVENVFHSDLGICDPEPIGYFSELLVSYIHVDDLFPFGNKNRRVKDVSQLLSKAKTKEQKRQICRYIGDFTVFWVGLYPENIRNLHGTGLGFSTSDFAEQGKKFYLIARRCTSSKQKPPPHLLEDLSNHYHDYVHGLSLCRKEFA